MKELLIEEKAQRYDEAIERAKTKLTNEVAFDIFPELKESEDERIRKELLSAFQNAEDSLYLVLTPHKKESFITWLEKQDEQNLANSAKTCKDEQEPADKVEPKFKVGDWVMLDRPVLITKVEDMPYNTHQYWTSDGTWFGDATKAKLWTIKDAKDGDVLVKQETSVTYKTIFIFNKIENNRIIQHLHYFTTDTNEEVCEARSINGFIGFVGTTVHPATKEQSNLLFQKMKEACYEWDAEKKELRKIERNLVWSEKDEKMLDTVIEDIVRLAGPKVCYYIDVKFLKRLKEIYTWKPSKEQIEAMQKALVDLCGKDEHNIITGLYYDLKKLREE